ncbi:MAG: HDOD domain-containing protein [Proteobacteria bacterium]|nr:HDOD domain-containing protein [Pseudomonadota bacterium]NOG59671.1 HDOD domain-containing protein [Pseudomonadota bacterium]
MSNLSLALAEDFLSNVKLPPQPEVLLFIQNELSKEEPDIACISENIVKDGALFSSILRLINSPFFGMRSEIKSIPHAISLIGLENLTTNIACIKFRNQMNESGNVSMPRYWDNATDVAELCSYLAKELGIASPAETYALGLFKDAGIPILAQKYEDYKGILSQQNKTELKNHTDLEDQYFNTNHCIVGYLMTKKWGMNKALREACLYHHDVEYMINEEFRGDEESRKLILISKIASYVANDKRDENHYEWLKIKDFILYYLGLSEPDFFELSENMRDFLSERDSI